LIKVEKSKLSSLKVTIRYLKGKVGFTGGESSLVTYEDSVVF